MVKKLEVGKSYELTYRIFLFEFNFFSRDFMFYGAPDDAIAEFKKLNKKFDKRGGKILEFDYQSKKVKVLKKF